MASTSPSSSRTRHPQRLGEGRASRSPRRGSSPGRSARSPTTSGARQQVHPVRAGKGGDENFNVYAVDPVGGARRRPGVPAARNLTDAKGARALIYAVPKRSPTPSTSASTTATRPGTTSTRSRSRPASARCCARTPRSIAGWVFDDAASCGWRARTTDNGDTEILRVDADGFTPVYTCSVFETCGPVALPQGRQARLLRPTRATPTSSRLVLFDPGDRQGGAGRIGPAEEGRLRRRPSSPSRPTSWSATAYKDEDARLLPRQGLEADYKAARRRSSPGKRRRLRRRAPTDEKLVAGRRDQRRRARRDLPVRPQDQEADARSTRCARSCRARRCRR